MKTSKEIYDKIIWDYRLDPDEFTLIIEDRFNNNKEISLDRFDPEEVPWHRIICFKRNGEVVWDRINKIDDLIGV